MISNRDREEAIIWCNIRACWWFNNPAGDIIHYPKRNPASYLAYQALYSTDVDLTTNDTLGLGWLEAEALLRDGWSPK